MDLELGFFAALLDAGASGYDSVVEHGISEESLMDEFGILLRFAGAYRKQYGGLPTRSLLLRRFGVEIPEADGPLDYYIGEIKARDIAIRLKSCYTKGLTELEAGRPLEALGSTRHVISDIDKTTLREARGIRTMAELMPSVLERYDRLKRGERGIPCYWKSLTDVTLGWWPQDLVVFVARTSVGKCIRADSTLVDPVTGVPHTIEQLVRDASLNKVCTWSKEQGVHARPITAKHDTGSKACLRFTLASGRSIEVTPEHPFLTPEGWRRADQISPKHTVAVPATMPFPEQPVSLPPAELDMLAVLMAEGSTSGHYVGFSTTDARILATMAQAADTLGAEVRYRGGADYDVVGKKGAKGLHWALVRKHGLAGCKAKDKVMPEAVWRLSREQLARFMSLFWMCGGYVTRRGPGVTLASKVLVEQIQSLLLRFGIQSSVKYKRARCNGKYCDAWRLSVYSKSWGQFCASLSLWGEKGARLEKARTCTPVPQVGYPHVGLETVKKLKEASGTQNGRWTSAARTEAKALVAARLGRKTFTPRDLFKNYGSLFSVSLPALAAYAASFPSAQEFLWWDSPAIHWDEVIRVEEAGIQKIYDLTVEPTSCFVANDILVHNTWNLLLQSLIAAEAGYKVLFATTEMSSERLAQRYLAIKGRLPYGDFSRGQLGEFAEAEMRRHAAELQEKAHNFGFVGGDFDYSTDALRRAIDEFEPQLVVGDGAYLFKAAGSTRTERAANAFDELKRIAKMSDVAVLVSTQFNREVSSNNLASIRIESIGLTDVAAWNSDVVISLGQTADMKVDNYMSVIPLKLREGASSKFDVNWNFETMDFSEKPVDVTNVVRSDSDEFSTGVQPSAPKGGGAAADDLPF